MERRKTRLKIEEVRKVLNCFINGSFTIKDVDRRLKEKKINIMNFYRLVYAGAIKKIGYGIYIRSEFFYSISAEEIYQKSQRELNKRTEANKLAKQAKINFPKTETQAMNEQSAINLLKSLGYKIMKPIQQFEEI